jgi:hypothetical protein
MMRIDRRLIWLTASLVGFALAGCCDSDKPLGVQEDTSGVPAVVVLGTGLSYGVFANDSVNSTGNTVITGDLGVSPGTIVTGSPTVSGTVNAGNATAATALVDLNAAITDVTARTGAITVSGNLGGLTLAPGVYSSTGPLTIDGDVTLNGLGNPNAVFIIRSASTLTVTPGSRVILASGAQAKNVIWQVGTNAIIGANSELEGTILATQNVNVDTGAVINGSVVAQTGVVTLNNVTIDVP